MRYRWSRKPNGFFYFYDFLDATLTGSLGSDHRWRDKALGLVWKYQ